jgi:hypothetical protein
VVVMFENENHSSVLGNKRAPYFNKLAEQGSNMTRSYGVTHIRTGRLGDLWLDDGQSRRSASWHSRGQDRQAKGDLW